MTKRKSALESTTLPGKLADCSEKDASKCEIFIVEETLQEVVLNKAETEDSRLFYLWGKMLNVEKAREDKVYGNEKLSPVITALGAGFANEMDLSKLRYHKVIIMADADVDGKHIRTLLLTFFYRYMRPLVDNGHVYIAQPPLFKVKKGKDVFYVYNERELDKLLAEKGWDRNDRSITLQRFKGLGEMNSEQLWETTMNPETRQILKVDVEDHVVTDDVLTLMGEKVEPRGVIKNAKKVSDLDFYETGGASRLKTQDQQPEQIRGALRKYDVGGRSQSI